MFRALHAVSLAVLLAGCGIELEGTGELDGRGDGSYESGASDATGTADVTTSTDDDDATLADDSGSGQPPTDGGQTAVDSSKPPACPYQCAASGGCVDDCSECSGLPFACGSKCVDACSNCSSGTFDCYCADHGSQRYCADVPPGQACPSHCACPGGATFLCPANDQVCVQVVFIFGGCGKCGETSDTLNLECKGGGTCKDAGGGTMACR